MEWTEELIARLKAYWLEGLSTAEIGRRLNISKNAVVGKAHRLDLPARPSPIRRDPSGNGAARPRKPRRVHGPTLPPLASAEPQTPAERPEAAAPAEAPARPEPREVAAAPAAKPAPERRQERRPLAVASSRPAPHAPSCCWPIGDPGTPNFHFCGAPAVPGKPYCGPHAEIAYVRVRDRREDAA